MLNTIIVHGRLTRDAELSYSKAQKPIASISIAVTSTFDKDHTSFFNCTAFGKTAEIVSQYLKKGSEVIINGEMKQERWTDKEGNNKSMYKLIVNSFDFCGSKPNNTGQNQNGGNSENSLPVNEQMSAQDFDNEGFSQIDEEVPF